MRNGEEQEESKEDGRRTELDIEEVAHGILVSDGGLEDGHEDNEEEDTIETLEADGLKGGDLVIG